MSQILCSTITREFFISFKIKLKDSLHDTLKSLIYVVFVDPYQGNKCDMPFSSYTKAVVEFIGMINA
jgi:hypothetical protein